MEKRIAILRGINVGGKRKIVMADFRVLLQRVGFVNVKTYIQSGNVVFETDANDLESSTKIEKAILENYGFEVPVIVRSSTKWKQVVDANPFANKEMNTLHVTFLKEMPDSEAIEQTLAFNFSPEQFQIIDQQVYLHIPGKYHETKLGNNFFEKKLKVATTTRNWKTVLNLLALSQQ